MKSLAMLLRQPVKSLIGVLLLALAGGILCAGVGQYTAAAGTREAVDAVYTTVALPTNKYTSQVIELEDGTKATVHSSDQPWEVVEFLDALGEEHPELVEQTARNSLASAWCPRVEPLSLTQAKALGELEEDGGPGAVLRNSPYTCAALAFTLEEIGEPEVQRPLNLNDILDSLGVPSDGAGEEETSFLRVMLSGTVTEAVFLSPGYDDPAGYTLRVTLEVADEAELAALRLETGRQYLVYGTDYRDCDWELRQNLALMVQAPVSEIDLANIEPLDPELAASLNADIELRGSEPVVALYNAEDGGRSTYLEQHWLDDRNACALTVWSDPLIPSSRSGEETVEVSREDGRTEIPAGEYRALYGHPGIVPLTGSVEDLVAADETGLWERALEQARVSDRALPVLAVERLESMVQFARQETHLSQGRSFTAEEYAQGSRVCVLSDALAAANGLAVGDRIDLTFYETDFDQPDFGEYSSSNPTAAIYSPALGFAGEAESYEIVGLYHQSDQWSQNLYSFTPNTVFVPSACVTCQTRTGSGGVFQTIVLRNGTVDQMEAVLAEAGYEGLFTYYDQGYSAIQDSLEQYFSVSRLVLLAGIGAWLGLLLLFLLLFPLMQRKNAARMWSLGASERQVGRHVLAGGMGLAAPGVLLGALLGYVLTEKLTARLAAEAELELTLRSQPWVTALIALIQLALCLGAVALCALVLVRGARKGRR